MNQLPYLEQALEELSLDDTEDTEIAVLYGCGFSVSSYYMESGNIRLIRGACELLRRMYQIDISSETAPNSSDHADQPHQGYADRTIADLVRWYSQDARILYSASGSFLIIAKKEIANQLSTELEICIHSALVTLPVSVVWQSTSVAVLKDADQFSTFFRELTGKLMERRYTKYPISAIYDNDYWEGALTPLPGTEEQLTFHQSIHALARNCKGCGFRRADYYVKWKDHDGIYLCPSCARKMRVNGGMKDVESMNMSTLLCASVNSIERYAATWQGNLNEKVRFEKSVQEVIDQAILDLLNQFGRDNQENHTQEQDCYVLSQQATDICILLPNTFAMFAGNQLLEAFEKRWNVCKEQGGLPNLTLSAGIAIGEENCSLTLLRQAAEGYLHRAQVKAHEYKEQSCLDIGKVDAAQEHPVRTVKKWMVRPFLLSESKQFLKFIRDCQTVPILTVRKVTAAVKNCSEDEAILWFRYLSSDRKNRGYLQRIKERYPFYGKLFYSASDSSKTEGSPFTKKCAWLDLEELYEQKEKQIADKK
ncbi:MAG: hypothetical protein LBM69_06965 [Lachnospiraceae bacterium]|jgi:hypothetical protein|nr:hypothetical protein [Lachnospiraceae bacterium]